ncbi:MAG TPA: TIGR00730 family Rossman fold protein [Rubrivivax sp.]|nr:TIGR00730 family Rossman fold protein [Burkholderiales bacterium]HNT39690.1 TIGR00730 family Rossman fold protein [Rubrivivax sp.]
MSAAAITLCVFCGSRHGALPAYAEATRTLGAGLAARAWQLVYGGGKVGLMGVLADAARAGGARVTGVIPQSLMEREVGHRGLDELLIVPNMHVRKRRMAERADAFLALPGGLGTFEELFEIWTWRQLGYHQRPIALLNTAGYYDPLLRFLQDTVVQGFVAAAQAELLLVDDDPERLLARIAEAITNGKQPPDLSRT